MTVSMLERIGHSQNDSVIPYISKMLTLAFGRGSPVTAHGGHNERLATETFQVRHRTAQNQSDIGDAATAGRHRHALARTHL